MPLPLPVTSSHVCSTCLITFTTISQLSHVYLQDVTSITVLAFLRGSQRERGGESSALRRWFFLLCDVSDFFFSSSILQKLWGFFFNIVVFLFWGKAFKTNSGTVIFCVLLILKFVFHLLNFEIIVLSLK